MVPPSAAVAVAASPRGARLHRRAQRLRLGEHPFVDVFRARATIRIRALDKRWRGPVGPDGDDLTAVRTGVLGCGVGVWGHRRRARRPTVGLGKARWLRWRGRLR